MFINILHTKYLHSNTNYLKDTHFLTVVEATVDIFTSHGKKITDVTNINNWVYFNIIISFQLHYFVHIWLSSSFLSVITTLCSPS